MRGDFSARNLSGQFQQYLAHRQQVNAFGNHVQHLIDTGNKGELARIGGILDDNKTRMTFFDQADAQHKERGWNTPAADVWQRLREPDTAMISLSDDGPDYHHK